MKEKKVIRVGSVDVNESDCWRTPRWLFDAFDKRHRFGLDAAARAEDKLCEKWLGHDSPYGEAISTNWTEASEKRSIWVNPPYGPGQLASFVGKMIAEAARGAVIYALLPATPSTAWFKKAFDTCTSIWFIEGRVAFDTPDGQPSSSPRGDTCVIAWNGYRHRDAVGFPAITYISHGGS